MGKKSIKKVELYAEAGMWLVFVLTSGLGALSLLKFIGLTDHAQAVVGYILAAYTGLVLAYLVYKAVENK